MTVMAMLICLLALVAAGLVAPVAASALSRPHHRGALGGAAVAMGCLATALLAAGWTAPVEAAALDAPSPPLEVAPLAPGETAEAPAPAGEVAGREALESHSSAASAKVSSPPASPRPASPQPAPADRVVELPPDFQPPNRTVVIPQRPEWVEREAGMTEGRYELPVSSALGVVDRDCLRSLDERVAEAVSRYVRDYLGSEQATTFVRYDMAEINRRLVDHSSTFVDTVQTSLGNMQQAHTRLLIPDSFRAELDRRWESVVTTGRLVKTVGLMAGAVVLLGMLFGYFKLDTATKGYYTGRLQVALATAILALVVLGVFYTQTSVRMISWLLHTTS